MTVTFDTCPPRIGIVISSKFVTVHYGRRLIRIRWRRPSW